MAHELNLIPTDVIEREEWVRTLFRWGGPVLLGIVAVSAVYGIFTLWNASLRQETSRLHQARALSQTQAMEMNEKMKQLQVETARLIAIEKKYQDLVEKHSISSVMAVLSQGIPRRVLLTRLEMDASHGITLQGRAVSHTELADFFEWVQRSPHFPRISLQYARREQAAEKAFVVFEIKKK